MSRNRVSLCATRIYLLRQSCRIVAEEEHNSGKAAAASVASTITCPQALGFLSLGAIGDGLSDSREISSTLDMKNMETPSLEHHANNCLLTQTRSSEQGRLELACARLTITDYHTQSITYCASTMPPWISDPTVAQGAVSICVALNAHVALSTIE